MWSSWNDLWHWCCLEADQIVEEFWTLSNYGHSKAKSYYHRSNMTSEVFWLFLSSLAFQRLKGNFFFKESTLRMMNADKNWYLLAFWQYLAINHDFHYRFIFFLFWDSVFYHKSSSVQIKKKNLIALFGTCSHAHRFCKISKIRIYDIQYFFLSKLVLDIFLPPYSERSRHIKGSKNWNIYPL